ncbi:glycoside hydrolase family 6 protein [Microbispora sp. NEAU-D428]|uniref:glycoside hydrolase family 6 protein n=1 Tax=Microbispora sitophila TaxID=2771537 RepID=UPI0018661B9B|nr:glycoside hydrolase family 6 protein [Microbispora sitophila]MBE3015659.1 glycoside hydrolase family 6 protein [Microbispora sitophila]
MAVRLGTRLMAVVAAVILLPVTAVLTSAPAAADARADNPYVAAGRYVDPWWSASAAAEPGGAAVANQPTGVWLDRVSLIEGTAPSPGLRAHLNEAVRQDAFDPAPLTIQIVLNDLPDRNCTHPVSNGDFSVTSDGLNRYRTEYVDPIAEILADPAYQRLRIVAIVEPDFLPGLLLPATTPRCAAVQASGAYPAAVRYALTRLHAIPNVYVYLDASHHGVVGHPDNFGRAAGLLASIAGAAGGGPSLVHGFTVNVANYGALVEPYFTALMGKNSRWVDGNDYVDELSFAQAFRKRLIMAGFASDIGMVIDTSRNGWGGPNRPTRTSTSGDLNRFVDESRTDRRHSVGNWCNQAGAGLGARPTAIPAAGIDAYAWIKPPGVSDGSSVNVTSPDGIRPDPMCDPAYSQATNGYVPSGALPYAPAAGQWFGLQFQQLLANAYPPL